MNIKSALLIATSLSLTASGAALAGGVAPAAEPMVMAVPASDPTDIGYLELSFGTMLQNTSLDSDFDESAGIFSTNGQAFARIGNFVIELQGYSHADTDDNDDEEFTASVGAFGHYMFGLGNGTADVFAGLTSGALIEEDEGVAYGVIGAGYSGGPWFVSLGTALHHYGDEEAGIFEYFHFLAGGYDYAINEMWSVGVEGMVGTGTDFSDNHGDFHEVSLSAAYDMSERMRFTGAITGYSLSERDAGSGDSAAGVELSLGLSISLGGSNREARDAIPFDTPNLHRPVTWADAAF